MIGQQPLTPEQLAFLRTSGLLTENEYAYIAGDLVVAENTISSEKRLLGKTHEVLAENRKRVLLG